METENVPEERAPQAGGVPYGQDYLTSGRAPPAEVLLPSSGKPDHKVIAPRSGNPDHRASPAGIHSPSQSETKSAVSEKILPSDEYLKISFKSF